MRILQIAPCYVDIYNESGGVSNIVRQICLKLDKNNVETILICSNTFLGKFVSKPRIIYYSPFLTIHIIKQNSFPLLGPISSLKILLDSIDKIDIAHIHTNFSTITDFSLKYLTSKSIPCIFTPHGKLSPNIFNNYYFIKYIYFHLFSFPYLKKVNQIIVSSSNEVSFIKKFGLNQINTTYIYNGYSNLFTTFFNINYFDLKPKKYLLFLGYLDPRKQPDLLIKAFSNSKAIDNYTLVFAGSDSYGFKKELDRIINYYNINHKIVFLGQVNNDIKWHILKNAKVLVLPSKGEGWPVVIAEAIGAGIPMILSKDCNFSEINDLNIGIEVSDYKIENWSNAINEICFNDSSYMEYEINLLKCKFNFTWDFITNLWYAKYKEVHDKSNK